MSKITEKKENLISLKEAAEVSGYSADYIGELIRKGKISGKQVYYNIAWMTTKQAILEYKQREKKRKNKTTFKEKLLDFFEETKQKIISELKILKLFIKTFKYVLPIIVVLILSFSMLLFYFFIYLNKDLEKTIPQETRQETESLRY